MTDATPDNRCSRCTSALERGDLRCAVCGQAVLAREREVATPTVEILRCRDCKAAVAYDAAVQAPRCAFCAATMEVEQLVDPPEQIEAHLPFTVEESRARAALSRWMSGLGFFRPANLQSRARLESLSRLWWVGWVCDAAALVSWTADSDHGARRSAWAPHAGQATLRLDNLLVSASRGLSDEETQALAPAYDLSTASSASPASRGATVERFAAQRSTARREVVQAITAKAAERVAASDVPGTRMRNLHVEPLLQGLTTGRFAFPAYIIAYRYRDDLYRAVVSGQGDAIVHSSAPLSWVRILAVAGGALALIGLAVAACLLAGGR